MNDFDQFLYSGGLDASYEAPPEPDTGVAEDFSGGSPTSADVFIQSSTSAGSGTINSQGTSGGGGFWSGLANILGTTAVAAGSYEAAKATAQQRTMYPYGAGVARPGTYPPQVPGVLQQNKLLPLLLIGGVALLLLR